MKRLGFLGYSLDRFGPAVVALAGALAVTLSTRAANAGCGDGACGRVDWTEVTASRQGTAVAAKLHGPFSWESSPDGWATHPIGGTLVGYVWLSCVPPGDSGPVETTCTDRLATEMAKAGTNTPLTWGGTSNFDTTTLQPIVPKGLYSESEAGAASYLVTFLSGSPINQAVCATVLAFPRDGGAPVDAAGSTGGASGGGGSPAATGGAPVTASGGATAQGGTHGMTDGSIIFFPPDSGTNGSAGTNGGGMHGGGTSSGAGGTSSAGGSAGPTTARGGDATSHDTGGSNNGASPAADAGGGCAISTGAALPTDGSRIWATVLVLGLAAVRRARGARRSL